MVLTCSENLPNPAIEVTDLTLHVVGPWTSHDRSENPHHSVCGPCVTRQPPIRILDPLAEEDMSPETRRLVSHPFAVQETLLIRVRHESLVVEDYAGECQRWRDHKDRVGP